MHSRTLAVTSPAVCPYQNWALRRHPPTFSSFFDHNLNMFRFRLNEDIVCTTPAIHQMGRAFEFPVFEWQQYVYAKINSGCSCRDTRDIRANTLVNSKSITVIAPKAVAVDSCRNSEYVQVLIKITPIICQRIPVKKAFDQYQHQHRKSPNGPPYNQDYYHIGFRNSSQRCCNLFLQFRLPRPFSTIR